MKLKQISLLILSLSLSGCVAMMAKSFDPASSTNVRTIAVAVPYDTRQYAIAPQAFGLSGGNGIPLSEEVAEMQKSYKRNDFGQQMAEGGLYLGGEFQAALVKELSAQGYQATTINLTSDVQQNLLGNAASVQADAILTSAIIGGAYVDGLFGGSYTPQILIDVMLTEKATHKILFRHRYGYSNGVSPVGVTTFPVDERYSFKSFKAVLENPDLAAEGLRVAIPMIAREIGVALKRP